MKTSVNFLDANRNRVTVEIEISNGKLSMTCETGNGCGQILDSINPANEAQRKLVTMWQQWHLNDMHAGTPEQEAAIEKMKQDEASARREARQGLTKLFIEKEHAELQKRYEETFGPGSTLYNSDFYGDADREKFINDNVSLHKAVKEGEKADTLPLTNYDFICGYLRNMHLLTVQHEGQPYRYGTAWLKRELPADIEEQIEQICEEIEEAENERKGESLEKLTDAQLLELIEQETEHEEDEALLFAALVRNFNLTQADFEDITLHGDGRVTVQGKDYLAGTDEEMQEKAKEYILETVWAFTPSFLSGFTGIDAEVFEAIQNNGKCESNNRVILSMIEDEDAFCDEAVSADGRGHFLNNYDGGEDTVTIEGTKFFIYQN